jgi:sulfate/thiosulfate transport system permease protein
MAVIALPRARRHGRVRTTGPGRLALGVSTLWLSLLVLLPLAAVLAEAVEADRWSAAFSGRSLAALQLTIGASLLVAVINAVMGTVIAYVLVRDDFRGKGFVNALIDLPFALPTIVAGLTLLALYGPRGPIGDVAFTKAAVVLALLFVTLPFVVRAVQPVLIELDREAEEAAASLGASPRIVLRRIVLPTLAPAIISGAALSFARAVGEFGALVLISGNRPYDTEVSSVFVFGQIESDAIGSAAAVSVVLLALSLGVLLGLRVVERRGLRHGA